MATTRPLDPTGSRDNLILGGAALGLAVALVGGLWVSLHLAAWLDGTRAPLADPLRLVVAVVTGRQAWTSTASYVAAGLVVVLLVLIVGVVLVWPHNGKRMRPDRSARHMGRGHDLQRLTAAGAAAKANQFGTTWPGLPIGKTVAGRRMLYSSAEDMLIMIAGPRTQKTTAYAVPALLAAPGAVLATSNKRDIVDATQALRAGRGRVWVFDPQHVANTARSWWWNPLSYIARHDSNGGLDISEIRAEKLAGQFVQSTRPAGARQDAYFDGEAENLIGLLLLAAACGGLPITTVYTWLTEPSDETATDLLKAHEFTLQRQSLYALAHLPERQREGVYGTARALMGFLRSREIVSWVTAGTGDRFDPHAFAASTDTLYPLSREGEGSVGPLVAALTMAVFDALEERATASPGGRLTVPFVGVLDEAANICRLRNLDSQYSHYGSRGIVLFTILQSWHQGAEVWGDHGIEKLWSAANVKIYGGGVDDDRYLRRLSDLIGTAEHITRTSSVGRGTRTVTRSVHDKVILTPAQLRELPQGRAVVFASSTPAVLIEPQPWFRGKDADKIQASIEAATT